MFKDWKEHTKIFKLRITDEKRINNQCKSNLVVFIDPQPGFLSFVLYPCGCKMVWKRSFDNLPAWGKPYIALFIFIHTLLFVCRLLILYLFYVFGYLCVVLSCILVLGVVFLSRIFYVDCGTFGIWCCEYWLEEYLDCWHIGHWCIHFTNIVNFVPSFC